MIAQAEGAYRLSTTGLTLVQVGFVHCAFEEQVARVANSFYRGVPELVVLRISIERLNPEVRFEAREGSSELFPHVYGPLNLDAIDTVVSLVAATDGIFSFPPIAS